MRKLRSSFLFGVAVCDLGRCHHDDKTFRWLLTRYITVDFFVHQGGNFIDTANNYQSEESEKWIGEWMKKRGVRDQMVIATKYTTCFRAGHGENEILANFTGNGTKSLHTSVNASLRKLQTDYIDLVSILDVAIIFTYGGSGTLTWDV